MRRILVVGAGQSGLQLALGLLAEGYDVTLVSPSGPAEIRAGRITSTQCLFGPALRRERRHGLAFWDDRAPEVHGVGLRVADPTGADLPDLAWRGRLDEPARSVDQRLKLSTWLELFVRDGGHLIRRPVRPGELAGLATEYELVVVATGRGGLSDVFPIDHRRSPHDAPQRSLALVYAAGAAPHPDGPVLARTAVPGAGEVFSLPTLSLNGPCDALMVEAVPGGPLDRPLPATARAEEVLDHLLRVVRRYAPWEYERFAPARPADPMAALTGGHTPVVRVPVARLDGGVPVLGMADTVVATDPITAQGANMASLAADVHRRAIVDHGTRPFDERFMRETFAEHWRRARQVVAWSRVMLSGPPHVWELYRLAARHQATADRFANSFADPTGLIEWFLHPERAMEYIDGVPDTAPVAGTAS
ncbi:styrene monooxygenase/indole monooxygenase family protein [Nocardiopsis lambiniae]|uniref:Styrene monooxygenase/indole monooxygenase family protein n=1 Tax=Nocardiopsis lambiniae TaxID=3075539 RepID=A0ABU2MA82_9ACTN|nr:styrene monooxygenase/indole monooxygenase family protein [Nocardiopsis sp. DSM 44743]MDT0329583.1 styrene monooxygenase/indole monooxygenase family protein [Nocardiopsis sp. DSM 44743]